MNPSQNHNRVSKPVNFKSFGFRMPKLDPLLNKLKTSWPENRNGKLTSTKRAHFVGFITNNFGCFLGVMHKLKSFTDLKSKFEESTNALCNRREFKAFLIQYYCWFATFNLFICVSLWMSDVKSLTQCSM